MIKKLIIKTSYRLTKQSGKGHFRTLLLTANVLVFLMISVINSQGSDMLCEVISAPGGAWRTQTGSSVKSSLRVGDVLRAKDHIEVAKGSVIELAFDRERLNVLHIEGETSMQISELFPTSIELSKGKMFALLNNKNSDRRFKLVTPTAIAAVRGTEFQVNCLNASSQILTYSGLVQVSGRNPQTGYETKDFILLRANQKTNIKSSGQIPEPEPLTVSESREISTVQEQINTAKSRLTLPSREGASNASEPKKESGKLVQNKSEEKDLRSERGKVIL